MDGWRYWSIDWAGRDWSYPAFVGTFRLGD